MCVRPLRGHRSCAPLSANVKRQEKERMRTLLTLIGWCLLFVLCWPLALLTLVLWPIVWLLSIPFRLVRLTFTALFAFLGALFFLPARVLGYRRKNA